MNLFTSEDFPAQQVRQASEERPQLVNFTVTDEEGLSAEVEAYFWSIDDDRFQGFTFPKGPRSMLGCFHLLASLDSSKGVTEIDSVRGISDFYPVIHRPRNQQYGLFRRLPHLRSDWGFNFLHSQVRRLNSQ